MDSCYASCTHPLTPPVTSANPLTLSPPIPAPPRADPHRFLVQGLVFINRAFGFQHLRRISGNLEASPALSALELRG